MSSGIAQISSLLQGSQVERWLLVCLCVSAKYHVYVNDNDKNLSDKCRVGNRQIFLSVRLVFGFQKEEYRKKDMII